MGEPWVELPEPPGDGRDQRRRLPGPEARVSLGQLAHRRAVDVPHDDEEPLRRPRQPRGERGGDVRRGLALPDDLDDRDGRVGFAAHERLRLLEESVERRLAPRDGHDLEREEAPLRAVVDEQHHALRAPSDESPPLELHGVIPHFLRRR